jgi:hypothetical protein
MEPNKRGRKKHLPYQCPRCHYSTSVKKDMASHLYKLKAMCPSTYKAIELTEEVKQYILQFRVYQPEAFPQPTPSPTITQVINQHQTINSFIVGIDVFKKLDKYVQHQQIEIQDFEDMVGGMYQTRVKQMESNKNVAPYTATHFIDLVDDISDVAKRGSTYNFFESYNVHYDDKLKKIHLYEAGKWNTYRYDNGITAVIESIALSLLYAYEVYLIKSLESRDCYGIVRGQLEDSLDHYFRFLSTFKVDPQCAISPDEFMDAFGDFEGDTNEVVERYVLRFEKVGQQMRFKEKNDLRKQVQDTLKHNSEQNIKELNRRIVELVKMDDGFLRLLQ